MVTKTTAPRLRPQQTERPAEPDLVDRVFDYLLQHAPTLTDVAADIKSGIRRELGGERHYVRSAAEEERQDRARAVLRLFNGRNAREVARVLGISRTAVYRYLKQPGSAPGARR